MDRLIQQEWSPVEIRGRLAQEGQRPISHEWIDQHVYRDQQAGGTWYRSLRCQRQRRKRYGCPERRGQLKNRVSIDARPAIVNQRRRIGDWEGDPLIGVCTTKPWSICCNVMNSIWREIWSRASSSNSSLGIRESPSGKPGIASTG